jgi:hypothetical protein
MTSVSVVEEKMAAFGESISQLEIVVNFTVDNPDWPSSLHIG